MPVYKGFVGKINEKAGGSGRKAYTLYSTKLQDENGEDSSDWISFGFEKPKVKTGDYVKITVDDSGQYPKVTEIKPLKNAPARVDSSKAASPARASAAPSGDARQQSIHFQSSRNAAIAAVELLVAHDALGLPKAGTKPAEAKRYDIITAAIDKLTVQYFYDVETMRILATVADAGAEKDTKPDAPLPEDPESDEDDEEEDEEQDDEEEDEDE